MDPERSEGEAVEERSQGSSDVLSHNANAHLHFRPEETFMATTLSSLIYPLFISAHDLASPDLSITLRSPEYTTTSTLLWRTK